MIMLLLKMQTRETMNKQITPEEIKAEAKEFRINEHDEGAFCGFIAGAEWAIKELTPAWVDVDEFKPQHVQSVLGCHFHDNWLSIIHFNEKLGRWFNDWDHDCECWPSHIMELPELPYAKQSEESEVKNG